MSPARAWHVLTASVTVAAVVLQLVLVVQGGRVLDDAQPPGLGLRLARLVAYFTIQSNVLVAVATTLLARDPQRDGRAFRALRLAATVGITVTGLVHFLLLRPLLSLHGADWAADKLLHMVVPVLAFAGWCAFGPRPRIDARAVVVAFAWPLAWLALTLVVAALTGWVPYPFLDVRAEGWTAVATVCVAITALFGVLIAGFRYADRRLAPSGGAGAADPVDPASA